MEFIKTIYDGKDQWWLAEIERRHFTFKNDYLTNASTLTIDPIKKWLKQLDNLSVRDIKMYPIIEKNEGAKNSLSYLRGSEDDKTPFIYRGASLPRIQVKLTYKSTVHYDHIFQFRSITEGSKTWLDRRFTNQLLPHFSTELLSYLVSAEKRRVCITAVQQVKRMKEELDSFLEELEGLV